MVIMAADMSAAHLRKGLIASFVAVCLLPLLLYLFSGPDFQARWRGLKDGMTQAQVAKALGTPDASVKTQTIGAGDRPVTRWLYKRGRFTYGVDFDYIGAGGAPVVYRTERFPNRSGWPDSWPWQRAKARA